PGHGPAELRHRARRSQPDPAGAGEPGGAGGIGALPGGAHAGARGRAGSRGRSVMPVKRRAMVTALSTRPQMLVVSTGILLVVALAYGTLLPFLGYYWDDWLVIAGNHQDVKIVEQQFRPFLWATRAATFNLLGERPLPWHLLALLARGLSALAFWWTASGLLPKRSFEMTVAS